MSVMSELFSGAAGAILVLAIQKGASFLSDRRDSGSIYKWLESESRVSGSPDFRTTRAIASHTNLTEERVRLLCSTHPLIFLSTGTQPDLWTIKERARNPQHQIF
jgi:hypothetical protein